MIRTQIQLRKDQSECLRRLAAESGCSVAELIRQSVDRFVNAQTMPAGRESRLAALEVVGWGGSGLSDVSSRHDDYLDSAYLDADDSLAGSRETEARPE